MKIRPRFGAGATETIPVVHNGVIYVVTPGAVIEAIDGTNGELIWEYAYPFPPASMTFVLSPIDIPAGSGFGSDACGVAT